MNKQEYIQKSSEYLGRLVYEIKALNASGLFDINTVAEDFFVPILSVLYGCDDLINLNQIQMNFPSVDLGCQNCRVSFQITSDPSSDKIAKTLLKFCEHNLEQKFDCVYILIITEKHRTYSSKKLVELTKKLPIDFRTADHILDYKDLTARLNRLNTKDLAKIHSTLETEFSKKDEHLQFRENLEQFLEFGRRKIEVEKKTKKYIPSVFVETTSAKDAMRLFAHPTFFHRKIDDAMERIDFGLLNKWLGLAGERQLSCDLALPENVLAPSSLDEVTSRVEQQRQLLTIVADSLEPFSWRGSDSNKYERANEDVWDIFRYRVGGLGSGLQRICEEAISFADLTQAKIFLITGMAGQGKTNFVCDLVENQFGAFEIPSIFIPARDLNALPAPTRILDFIKHSRYAPKVGNIHELLEIFESIAKENQKPFIIAIDGINEVTALTDFNSELTLFLEALCQYEHVKVLITCRSEFFDQRFSSILDEAFSGHIFRIQDLRSQMSEDNKERLLEAYFEHFSISLRLSNYAAEFLMNDLLLLRIFCELHENEGGEYVQAIYKGDLFEEYLKKKVSEFSVEHQKYVLPTLHKIAKGMLDVDAYTNLSTRGFDPEESRVVGQLISEDIVLRREVPDAGLAGIGDENISFTYDEMRDFIIAEYLASRTSGAALKEIDALFQRLPKLPIYEGVFRYTYIAARKANNTHLLSLCEGDPGFLRHYVRNLPLLSASLQNEEDASKIKDFLKTSNDQRSLRRLAEFLFNRRDDDDIVHIRILTQHVGGLSDLECRKFFDCIFSNDRDDGYEGWRSSIGEIVTSFFGRSDEELARYGSELLTFLFQIVGFADWSSWEAVSEKISSLPRTGYVPAAITQLRKAKSETITRCAEECFEQSEDT